MLNSPAVRWLSVRCLGLFAGIATMVAFTGVAAHGMLQGGSSISSAHVTADGSTSVPDLLPKPSPLPTPGGFLW